MVKEEDHRLFCGNGGLGLAGSNGAERKESFAIDRLCIREQ
jgi:hypothetical protein